MSSTINLNANNPAAPAGTTNVVFQAVAEPSVLTITAVANSGGLFKVTTSAPHNLINNDAAYIYSPLFLALAGSWALTKIDATNLTLQGSAYSSGWVNTDPTTLLAARDVSAYYVPGLAGGVNLQTASYTAIAGDNAKLISFDDTASPPVNLTLTLPAASPFAKWVIAVQNVGKGTLTIDPNGNQLDNVAATLALGVGNGCWIFTDGANYFTERGVSPAYADNETPAGAMNGANQTYTLAFTPLPAASLQLYFNGVLLLQGTDYTISGATITLINAFPNSANNEWLRAWYRH